MAARRGGKELKIRGGEMRVGEIKGCDGCPLKEIYDLCDGKAHPDYYGNPIDLICEVLDKEDEIGVAVLKHLKRQEQLENQCEEMRRKENERKKKKREEQAKARKIKSALKREDELIKALQNKLDKIDRLIFFRENLFDLSALVPGISVNIGPKVQLDEIKNGREEIKKKLDMAILIREGKRAELERKDGCK